MLRCSLGILLGLSAAAPASADELDWLSGTWCSEHTEELWRPEHAGLRLGMNRSLKPGRADFEFMRIETSTEGRFFIAQPGGQQPTRFAQSESGEQRVGFSNPEHDYPRRVRYWREGTQLHASIDDGSGGNERRFQWSSCAGGTAEK